MKDETELQDKYEPMGLPESWQVSLPHGKFVRMPKDQAEALLEGANKYLSLMEKYRRGLETICDTDALGSEDESIIKLFRKGIGK